MSTEGRVVHVTRGTYPPAEIVVNLGAEHGINERSTFLIYVIGDDILDPDSGTSLGKLEKIHGRGRVKHVQARMTTVVPMTRRRQVSRKSGFVQELVEDRDEDIPFDADIAIGDLVRVL
jgi:hypothetical protein